MTQSYDVCDPAEVAALVKAGDAAALERITRCYLDRLMGVGLCACRDPHAAQDAVQDAMVSAAQHLHQFRGDGSVEAWIARMVVNACRCGQRGRKNDPNWNRQLDEDPRPAEEDPARELERRQLAAALARAVDALPPIDRQLFIATQIEGLAAPEAAHRTGISPDAVRARLVRIRRRLRTTLADEWRDWNQSE
jgi:RNA polymerase sigma-70 factor (ECF subfamily)